MKLIDKVKKLSSSLHLLKSAIYPRFCWHCNQLIPDKDVLFCDVCAQLLTLLSPKYRCRFCFYQKCKPSVCIGKNWGCQGVAAALDYIGPIVPLVRKFKYEKKTFLKESLEGFLHLQLIQLKWPDPDYIIPVPQGWLRKLERGYNQSELLAEGLSKRIEKSKSINILRCVSPYHTYSGTSKVYRRKEKGRGFKSIPCDDLREKRVLLIDDVRSTGQTIQLCIEALWGLFPKEIYVLTLCQVDS